MTPTTVISILVGIVLAFLAGRLGKRRAVQDAKTEDKIKALDNQGVADDLEKRVK